MAVLASNVVIQQPQTTAHVAITSNQWSTGILDCFDDCSSCCFATWCFPIFACSTAADAGESCILPGLDYCFFCVQYVGICCYTPPISLAMRASIRNRYGIQGSLASDCLYATFCNQCSWCQMSRELKRRRATFALVNVQPTVVAAPAVVRAALPPVVASQSTVISQATVVC